MNGDNVEKAKFIHNWKGLVLRAAQSQDFLIAVCFCVMLGFCFGKDCMVFVIIDLIIKALFNPQNPFPRCIKPNGLKKMEFFFSPDCCYSDQCSAVVDWHVPTENRLGLCCAVCQALERASVLENKAILVALGLGSHFCCHEACQQGHNAHQCSITLTFVYG